jgi:hypothetical protein
MSPEPERVPGLSRGKGRTENPRIYAGVAVALSRLGALRPSEASLRRGRWGRDPAPYLDAGTGDSNCSQAAGSHILAAQNARANGKPVRA